MKLDKVLNELTEYAKTFNGNALEISVRAIQARCTVGEISEALEKDLGTLSSISHYCFRGLSESTYG